MKDDVRFAFRGRSEGVERAAGALAMVRDREVQQERRPVCAHTLFCGAAIADSE